MNKDVNDYLTEGMYGTRLPKEKERENFLGTYRERIVLALTVGQVMTDAGIKHLEEAMQHNKDTTLLINGHVSPEYITEEKNLAKKYGIPYTIITNEESSTNIGAVLTYDYAIDKEKIFIETETPSKPKEEEKRTNSFLSKLKKLFS